MFWAILARTSNDPVNPSTISPSPAWAALNTPDRKLAARFMKSATAPHCSPTAEKNSNTLPKIKMM